MQRVTPAKAFPTVASIEEVLYQNATTDLEYAKPGNLGLRITRAISDIERRSGPGTWQNPDHKPPGPLETLPTCKPVKKSALSCAEGGGRAPRPGLSSLDACC